MQLVIVHDDAEVGEQLVQMVKEYTEHHCGLATSEAGALDWARGVTRCSLLITQLRGERVDGFSLGGALSEMFAGLQTMFLPAYAGTEQRMDLAQTKIFPEPIDGERLLNAIARAEEQRQTGLDLFHALDLLQMCCLSRRDGALQLVKGSQTALVFLKAGQIVHVERGALRDAEALHEITAWESVEFAYDQYVRAPAETITGRWDEVLIAAVTRHKKQSVGASASSSAESATAAASAPTKTRWGIFGARK
ncbi:MAG: DUF4388 domain-containing protein [Verrucomicrobiota bacterium]|nr:DUF4388 domain-containing protein [Verrucomicrobiota bacterium]